MEADWEFEIGGDAPLIDAAWPGLVDLRLNPGRVDEIAEVAQLSGLRDSLLRLNKSDSPVWTAKCDVWQPVEFDPDELNAKPEEAMQCLACYLDLLPRNRQWPQPESVKLSCETWRATLHNIPLTSCRVDLVVRRAWLAPGHPDFGVTAYCTACGSDLARARAVLNAALSALAGAVAPGNIEFKSEFPLQ